MPPSDRQATRGPRPRWDRAQITAAAVGLADVAGLDAVSMRAVATTLGTAAASLYRYVGSREELVASMVDSALAELGTVTCRGDDVVEDLVVVARAERDLYQRHPWLLEALLLPLPMGRNALDHVERCLALMTPVCPNTTRCFEALALMSGVARLFAASSRQGQAPPPPIIGVDPTAHPLFSAALARPGPPSNAEELFERTVRSVVQGLLDD